MSVPQTGPYLRRLDEVRVLVTPDVQSDPDGAVMLGQGWIGPDAASRLDVPIRVRGKVIGVLVIAHHTARAWTATESRFAASLAPCLRSVGLNRRAMIFSSALARS